MLAVSSHSHPAPATAPTADILPFPRDRVRTPDETRGRVAEAVASLNRAVAAYAAAVRSQQAAIAEFLAATEAMHTVATRIGDTNGSVQQNITRILDEARLLRLRTTR